MLFSAFIKADRHVTATDMEFAISFIMFTLFFFVVPEVYLDNFSFWGFSVRSNMEMLLEAPWT